jgi:hypothetical protein
MLRGSGPLPDRVAGAGTKGPLIVVAALALTVCIGVIIYSYGDKLVDLAQSLLSGRAIHAQGHIRY